MMANIKVRFLGIDHFNRPVFKDVATQEFYGSVDKLLSRTTTEKETLQRIEAIDLLYFGTSFGCEPFGCEPKATIIILKEVIK